MGFPKRHELERVRKQLEDVEPTRVLPPDASSADRLKAELCRLFVRYLLETGESQAGLARRLGIDRSRMNEIVKYRVGLFTVDRLMEYAERLNPSIRVTVA